MEDGDPGWIEGGEEVVGDKVPGDGGEALIRFNDELDWLSKGGMDDFAGCCSSESREFSCCT